MKAVYLYPKSSFVTSLRSDTLWGLLMVAIKYVYSEEKLIKLLNEYLNGDPPFIISSAMPFELEFINGNSNLIHYFPRLILKPEWSPKIELEELNQAKLFKAVKYISLEDFEKLINEEENETSILKNYIEKELDDSNKLRQPIISRSDTLHTSIDPLTGTTREVDERGQLFYSFEHFIQNGGLYFLVEGEDLTYLESALRFLTHFGFGGDHSVGKGAFDFEIRNFFIRTPENPLSFVSLSLYNPTEEELTFFKGQKEKFWYEIVMRSGILGAQFKQTEFRKKSFFSFVEGSTFPIIPNKKYYGRLLNTMEIPPAYSNCFAFNIPARFMEKYYAS